MLRGFLDWLLEQSLGSTLAEMSHMIHGPNILTQARWDGNFKKSMRSMLE